MFAVIAVIATNATPGRIVRAPSCRRVLAARGPVRRRLHAPIKTAAQSARMQAGREELNRALGLGGRLPPARDAAAAAAAGPAERNKDGGGGPGA